MCTSKFSRTGVVDSSRRSASRRWWTGFTLARGGITLTHGTIRWRCRSWFLIEEKHGNQDDEHNQQHQSFRTHLTRENILNAIEIAFLPLFDFKDMEVWYLTVRCFLHPFCLAQAVEIAAPLPTQPFDFKSSPEVPSVPRSPVPEMKTRPKSAEPTQTAKIRASPVLTQEEYHKHSTLLTDKIKRSFKNSEAARNASEMIKKEVNGATANAQEVEWKKFCDEFKKFISRNSATNKIGKQIVGDVFDIEEVNGEDLYVKMLHFKVGCMFELHAKTLQSFDMFSKFTPIVMYSVQREFKKEQIVPSNVDGYMSYEKAIELQLLPKNIGTYIDVDSVPGEKWKLCCLGLFHSFIYRVNFVSAYWKCTTREEWKYSLVNFNRHDSTAPIL
jgi:hypothetical protein